MHLISIIYLLTSFYTSIITTDYTNMYEKDQTNELSVILEVDRDVNEVVREIENNYPKLEIITTYQLLFQGIALRGDRYSIQKLSAEHYIQSVFPVQAYVQLRGNRTIKNEMFEQATLPEEINQTSYTGKGVKVAVIDTGVDMTHPDLINNYKGGFDLVDLDDTPQETTLEEGLPTSHGTHVAGIIAANGTIKGVAPDAEIYAYRALGPGGVGTSVQVIAALEEAVKAGVDIINLSLGNHVNGPDYPTSRAVNEASKLGAIVVVANGNSGPQPWTVGSPATATNAFSIGAFEEEQMHTYLTDHRSRRQIKLYPFMQSPAWDFSNSYEITFDTEVQNVFGKMVFIDEWEGNIEQTIENLKRSGAIAIVTNQASAIQITHQLGQLETALPIAFIGENDKRYIQKLIHIHDQTYFRLTERRADETIAHFSSRGPVTLNWNIKPNVIAPGVNVLSTVPGGYAAFSGTSMAAPHVAGAIALLKEAKPHWSNEQIIAAIETSARKLYNQSGEIIPASVQGTGVIQIDKALTATTLIENGLLTFGKVNKIVEEKRTDITIYNESNDTKHYYFTHPENVSGLSWNMPLAFTIKPHSKKTIPIGLKVNRHLMKNEVEEGWITLNSDEEKFSLPYMVVNEPSNYVKISGFHFQLHPLQKSKFEYQLYVAEDVEQIEVKLFDRESLLYETTILTLKDVHAGYHEGELLEKDVTVRGQFYGIILVTLKNGSIVPYEIELQI